MSLVPVVAGEPSSYHPPVSINRFVQWTRLLAILGVESAEHALPAQATCPLCAVPSLRVHRDPILGGGWYHCSQCKFAGDGIELAAARWKITPAAAALRLSPYGFPRTDGRPLCDLEQAERHSHDLLERQQRARRFWQSCQMVGGNSPARKLQLAWGIPGASGRRQEWLQRGGSFIGTATRAHVHRTLVHVAKSAKLTTAVRGGGGALKSKVLSNASWNEVLVLPHCDLPGRIVGFTFCGREGRWPDDYLYYAVTGWPPAGVNLLEPEGGLIMYDAAAASGSGPVVLMVGNPQDAVRLQLAHLRESATPLPLAAAWCGAARQIKSSAMSLGREIVVTGNLNEAAEVLGLARRVAGRVSWRTEVVPRTPPRNILSTTIRQAIGTETATVQAFEQLESHQIGELSARIGLANDAAGLSLLRSRLTPERAASLVPLQHAGREVELGSMRIREVGDRWLDNRGRLLSDAPVHVVEILRFPTQNQCLIRAEVRYAGQRVPVESPLSDGSAGLRNAAQHACVARGLGLPIYLEQVARALLPLAQLFGTQPVRTGMERSGWDPELNGFRFPEFTLTAAGQVVSSDPTFGTLPGIRIPPPAPLTLPARVALASEDPAAGLATATLAAILAGLLAEPLRLPDFRIAVDGTLAVTTARAIYASFGPSNPSHRWPVFAPVLTTSRPASDILAEVPVHSAFAAPSGYAGALATQDGWAILQARGGSSMTAIENMVEHAPAIASLYLQDLLSRRLALPAMPCPVERILWDLQDWYQRITHRTLPAAAWYFLRPMGSASALWGFVATLDHVEGTQRGRRPGIALRTEDRIVLELEPLHEAVLRLQLPMPALPRIRQELETAGLLLAATDERWTISTRIENHRSSENLPGADRAPSRSRRVRTPAAARL